MKLTKTAPQHNNMLCDIILAALQSQLVEEVHIPIEHFVHDGVYYRTCMVPKGKAIIGAFIQIPTTIIVSGHCVVHLGDSLKELKGYHVIPAEANRRQAFKAIEDTYITMCFATEHTDVEECEKQATPEWKLLTNHREEL